MVSCQASDTQKIALAFGIVARKNALTDIERAICRRALQLRKGQRLSRTSFAEILQIEPARLAQYEYERVPVPYEVGRAICKALCVNQRWLATGKPPKLPFVNLSDIDSEAQQGAYFSDVYAEILAPHLEQFAATAVAAIGSDTLHDGDSQLIHQLGWASTLGASLEKLLNAAISGMLHYVPDDLKGLYAQHMVDSSKEFANAHAQKIDMWWDRFNQEFEAEQKLGVAKLKEIKDSPPVHLSWTQLRNRLKAATKPRGKRAELARVIGVKDANINSWLAKNVEPGADATFRLLEWVTAEEMKLKKEAPSVVRTPTAQKAQSGKTSQHEHKAKSNRR